MSPVGSAAWVLCLKFNQYSVDSSHSCSFKHKLMIFFRTQIIQIARIRNNEDSLSMLKSKYFDHYF